MEVGLLIGLFLIIALFFFFIWLFIYSKKRNSKVGIIFSSIALVCIMLIFFTNNIDELTISKADIKKDLNLLNIELNSDFEINENTVEGMPERNQKTKIKVTETDINKIINEIKQSKNFKEYKTDSEVYYNDISLNIPLNGQILNIKYPKYYSRELYKEIENIPTRMFLTIEEGKNIIEYQKLED